jgi:hypothetical protein
MTTINAVNSPSIRHAEFVRMVIGQVGSQTTYTFCNAAGPVTVSGITFVGLGSLLGISDVQRDIKATSDDMTVSLTGLDPAVVGIILGTYVKGSTVEMWRGFLDSDNQIITTPTLQFFKRYQGIINNVSITENFDTQLKTRIATCSVSCSSMRRILENRLSGVKTNQQSWQFFYPNDVSMNQVSSIANMYFDFGKPPQTQTQSTDTTTTNSQTEPIPGFQGY